MEKILIFIPMYNCEKQIFRVLGRIAALPEEEQKLFSQVLVVDNRSTDGSLKAAESAMEQVKIPVKLIRNCENYSLGGSHKVAFGYAIENGFDYVVVLHGDDQGDLADLVPYVKEGIHRKLDSLLGSRFSKGSRLVNYSRFRIFGNKVFNLFASLCAGRRIYDLGSGLNIYKTTYLKERFYLPFPNDLSFNVFLLLYGIYAKSEFRFFPLTWREEDQISNARLWKQTRRMLKLMFTYVFRRKKVFAVKENEYSAMDYRFEVMAQKER
ncbi:MAG: glycosyltransferase family 2 protein [Oscillospiraceae bacterium]|nr:glycosyltransferase family 2 protein [Oscillospiraceae bacterium]